MRKRPLRRYLSCYSCIRSKISVDEDGKKMVYCQLSKKNVQLRQGMPFPEWCEIAKSIRANKETI
ncbi:MAG: hypothetical protein U0L88_09600 [Acutalibacteraceae bacterium]|nr:hypothetical protein [Acutalibacteraceae bacterium]